MKQVCVRASSISSLAPFRGQQTAAPATKRGFWTGPDLIQTLVYVLQSSQLVVKVLKLELSILRHVTTNTA